MSQELLSFFNCKATAHEQVGSQNVTQPALAAVLELVLRFQDMLEFGRALHVAEKADLVEDHDAGAGSAFMHKNRSTSIAIEVIREECVKVRNRYVLMEQCELKSGTTRCQVPDHHHDYDHHYPKANNSHNDRSTTVTAPRITHMSVITASRVTEHTRVLPSTSAVTLRPQQQSSHGLS